MLPNRHPSPLDPNNEQGYQLAAGYSVDTDTYLDATYTITRTLPADSYFQRVLNSSNPAETQLEEFYVHAPRDWCSTITTIAALA